MKKYFCEGIGIDSRKRLNINDLKIHLNVCPLRPEDGEIMFLRNVGIYRQVYTAPKPRRTSSSSPP
jgi:hypothetical protein